MLPKDFIPSHYKLLNSDLSNMNENELINHYINHGQKENRLYKVDLPENFDVEYYRNNNEDLSYLSDIQCISHFMRFGIFENRVFSSNNLCSQKKIYNNFPDNFFVTMKNLGVNGRLGNQMFQYAILYKISKKYGLPIHIPIYDENYVCSENTSDKRKTKIQKYFSNLEFKILEDKDSYKSFDIIEKNFDYNEEYLNLNFLNFKNDFLKCLNYDGYFQSYKYFDDIYYDICRLYTFNNETKEKAENFLNSIKNISDKPIVSLHIRRGDLSNYNGFGPPINKNFINNSIEYIKQKINDFNILVLTDDLKWAKDNLIDIMNKKKDVYNIFYSNNSDAVDLCLLTLSDHLIISNSSFSWWGAYLNKNSQKIVVSKSLKNGSYHFDYIVPESDSTNFLPNDWIQLDDNLEDITMNIVYSTMFRRDNLLSLYKLGIIKNYFIENISNLGYEYDYGIVLPTFNSSEYLENLLNSLKCALYDGYKILIIIFDSESSENGVVDIIKNFNLNNIPIIKLYGTYNNCDKTILPSYLLRFCFDIVFRLKCKVAINISSNVIVSKFFIQDIDMFIKMNNNFQKYYLLNNFNTRNNYFYNQTTSITNNLFCNESIVLNKEMFYKYFFENIHNGSLSSI